jgi:hypothetical protein
VSECVSECSSGRVIVVEWFSLTAQSHSTEHTLDCTGLVWTEQSRRVRGRVSE